MDAEVLVFARPSRASLGGTPTVQGVGSAARAVREVAAYGRHARLDLRVVAERLPSAVAKLT